MTQRNLYRRDNSDDNEFIEEINEEEAVQKQEPSDPEETTFKKRYGDLRRYLNQVQDESNKKIQELQNQLESATDQNKIAPRNMEELKEWMDSYPKVAGLIKTLVQNEMGSLGEEIKKVKKEGEENQKKLLKERAVAELRKKHPDFYDSVDGKPAIYNSQEFVDWVEDKRVQDDSVWSDLYENETNAAKAAKWITLFKYETDYGKSKKSAPNSNEAALSNRKGSSSPSAPKFSQDKFDYLESEIGKMGEREYAANEQKINEALRKGRVFFDVSGAAS